MVGGWRRLAVGGRSWRLAAVGSGWMLATKWLVVVGGWRVAVGGGWWLGAVGSWWLVVLGGLSLNSNCALGWGGCRP